MKDAKKIAYLTAYILCIFFITLFSRTPELVHHLEVSPFWSVMRWLEGSRGNGRTIILNVLLFIPFGYLAAGCCRKKGNAILLGFALSMLIEVLQYFTMRGLADVDDLVFNTIGAAAGVMIYRVVPERGERIAVILMLAAGLAGCFYAEKNRTEPTYERQFRFDAELIGRSLTGQCYLYEGTTPDYQLWIHDKPVPTVRNGNEYRAEALDDGEISVRFKGHRPISTGVYIRDGEVKYTAVEPEIPGVPEAWTLMAYNEEQDTLVYQDEGRLVWLIGTDIDETTEIIYHIYTDEPEKLLENRRKYEFDNRGFRIGGENELPAIGHYRVFEKEIPQEYRVTAICVGFNAGGVISWREELRSEEFGVRSS